MNLFDRLSQNYTERHASEVHSWIKAAEDYASTFPLLPEGERSALIIIYASMNLTHSRHDRESYRSALTALIHPFHPGAPV